jgi:hypothetical protein
MLAQLIPMSMEMCKLIGLLAYTIKQIKNAGHIIDASVKNNSYVASNVSNYVLSQARKITKYSYFCQQINNEKSRVFIFFHITSIIQIIFINSTIVLHENVKSFSQLSLNEIMDCKLVQTKSYQDLQKILIIHQEQIYVSNRY